jgi:hypothetical protein
MDDYEQTKARGINRTKYGGVIGTRFSHLSSEKK